MSDRSNSSAAREWDDLALDHVLGELPGPAPAEGGPAGQGEAELRAFTAAVEQQRGVIAALRSELGCEPSGRVAVAMRQAIARREALLSPASMRELSPRRVLHFALRAAAVAAILLESQLLLQRVQSRDPLALPCDPFRVAFAEPATNIGFPNGAPAVFGPAVPERHDGETSADPALRAQGAEVARIYAQVKAEADRHAADGAVAAENQLSLRRFEISLCASPLVRKSLLTNGGETWLVDERVTDLAQEIADRIETRIATGVADTRELALTVRALVAAGSTLESGPYRQQLCAAGNALAERLSSLRESDLAIGLSALTDIATIHEGRAADLLGQHLHRLVDSILHSTFRQACELLSWSADLDALAEAGCVLRTAAAFGVPADAAYHARLLVLAHLQARAERLPGDRPDLAATVLYGFSDLVDRESWERRLAMVRARDFLPDGAAVMRFVWSRSDHAFGWCDLQRELRLLATERSPEQLADLAGLLLALSVNCAGPAFPDVLADAEALSADR
jgi:hypothetical protein